MHPRWPRPATRWMPKGIRVPVALALEVRHLVLDDGFLEAPINMFRVLEYAGIEHKEHISFQRGSGDGCIGNFGKLVIDTNSLLTRRDHTRYYGDPQIMRWKQRITIAHEIGHTIFYDRSSTEPFVDEIVPVGWSANIFAQDSDLEYFCEVFGASLLLSPWTLKLRPRYAWMSNELLSEIFGVPTKIVRWIRYGFPRDFFDAECLFMSEPE